MNYCKVQQITAHLNYSNFDVRFTNKDQKTLQLFSEQFLSLQTKVTYFPKSNFTIEKAGVGKSTVIKEIRKIVSEQLGSEDIMLLALKCTAEINFEGKVIYSVLIQTNLVSTNPLNENKF